jgi:hypothetical protein
LRGEVDEGGTSSGLGWDAESAEAAAEGLGGWGLAFAEVNEDAVAAADDLVGGHRGDPGLLLAE